MTNKESQEEPKDAFHPENFGPVTLIALMRLYDVGMALLSVHDAEKAATLADMHEKGLTFMPPPIFAIEEE